MDFSDKNVLTNVIGHVLAAIVSMAVVIRDVSQDGRDTIAMIEMSHQVFMSLIYPFNTMQIISLIYIWEFSTKNLNKCKINCLDDLFVYSSGISQIYIIQINAFLKIRN